MPPLDDLSNEVLLKVFINATPWMKHAVNISKVCARWNHVMKIRFSLVRYLVFYHEGLSLTSEPEVAMIQEQEEPDEEVRIMLEEDSDESEEWEAAIERIAIENGFNVESNNNNHGAEEVSYNEEEYDDDDEEEDEEVYHANNSNSVDDIIAEVIRNHDDGAGDEQFNVERIDSTGRFMCIDIHEDSFEIQKTYIELLPNLIFLTVNAPLDLKEEQDLINLINSKPNIKGIDWKLPAYVANKRTVPPEIPLKNIEMFLFGNDFNYSWLQLIHYLTSSVIQLHSHDDRMGVIPAVTRCSKLRRLHCFQYNEPRYSPNLRNYRGPVLTNLEILEIAFGPKWGPPDLKHFLRYLPNLKHIFLQFSSSLEESFPRPRKFFPHVESLVLEMSTEHAHRADIQKFEGFISMFPNLKHLGLRYFRIQSEDQLFHWLRRLSHLKLLDIREWSLSMPEPEYDFSEIISPFESTLSIDKIISWYQNLFNRRFNVKVTNVVEEEPQHYVDEIVEGFDFMGHVFYKDFQKSPHFMIDSS